MVVKYSSEIRFDKCLGSRYFLHIGKKLLFAIVELNRAPHTIEQAASAAPQCAYARPMATPGAIRVGRIRHAVRLSRDSNFPIEQFVGDEEE
jgi:hypothetical protein